MSVYYTQESNLRGGEERDLVEAGEPERRIVGADTVHTQLEVHDASDDKAVDESTNNLHHEGVTRGNLGVVAELEVTGKNNGMSSSDVT